MAVVLGELPGTWRSRILQYTGDVLPHDTSQAAHEAQMRALRRLTPAARVQLAVQMSEDARVIASAGIAARHPEYTVSDVRFALLRLLYGDELFTRAWPKAPVLAP